MCLPSCRACSLPRLDVTADTLSRELLHRYQAPGPFRSDRPGERPRCAGWDWRRLMAHGGDPGAADAEFFSLSCWWSCQHLLPFARRRCSVNIEGSGWRGAKCRAGAIQPGYCSARLVARLVFVVRYQPQYCLHRCADIRDGGFLSGQGLLVTAHASCSSLRATGAIACLLRSAPAPDHVPAVYSLTASAGTPPVPNWGFAQRRRRVGNWSISGAR